jgi:hypothetical protein
MRSPGNGRSGARFPRLAALASILITLPISLVGQEAETPETNGALRVFVDCRGRFCDFDFLRREVPFINYVRDRQDAQVHVLMTSQQTGAGGRNFVLDFIGLGELEGMDDRQEVSTPPQIPDEEVLGTLSRAIGLGLARYAARTGTAGRLRVVGDEGGLEQAVATPEDDRWDFWVFRTSMRAGLEGEDRQKSISLFGAASANRVTERLKVEMSVDGRYDREEFEVDDSTTVTSIERDYEFETLVVHSLGAHWSAGVEGTVEHSSFRNRELAIRIAPALEYNLFRYEDSERKQFTLLYTVGFNSFDWREVTLFGETSEQRFDQTLRASLAVRQPWGEAGGELQASHFLDDPDQHRIEGRAFVRLRLIRGLSLDVSGELARVRDQINLPVGDATQEEILLEIRELQTGFEYDISVGFSYTFGSIFNNVVNPRFEGGGGGGRRF